MSASHRKSTQVHARPGQTGSQVDPLRLARPGQTGSQVDPLRLASQVDPLRLARALENAVCPVSRSSSPLSHAIYCLCILEDIHVFPEGERTSYPEDTVHMQELRRLHINDDHHRPHYRHPPG